MGVDWRINIDQAWTDISYRSAVQGNLDPVALFAPLPELKMKIAELLKRTGTRPGHIFNVGHGILPVTKPAQKDLAKLPAREAERVRAALLSMRDDPFRGDIKRLAGQYPA